jgi:TRAP-type C4-dicarboxylate transport system permease large subunit
MTYQVGSACYPTATAAAQVSASAEIGKLVPNGSITYVVDATSADENSITYILAPVGGGTAITVVAPYTAQPCNMLELTDGLEMGWAIGAAWLGAFALLFLTRAMRGETGGDYGNT